MTSILHAAPIGFFDPAMLVRLWKLLMLVPVLMVVGIVVGILLVTLVHWGIRGALRRHSIAAAKRAKRQPDGRPWPPHCRGLCDRCANPADRVYHMPEGRRLCHACYVSLGLDGGSPPPPPARARRSEHAR
ncbi:MAG: hypothetical protein ACLFV7_03290 [Phycisphaerae bacterium]